MTQEYKELLLKDVCARLPYGIIFQSRHNENEVEGEGTFDFRVDDEFTLCKLKHTCELDNCKPYLRPMSSMTEDEKIELKQISNDYLDGWENTKTPLERWKLDAKISYLRFVFYNSHHFDWNDLIPKGLAIEVTEENNPYK